MSSESDLAKKIIAWLEGNGWDCYQEVFVGNGYPRPDIVARRGAAIHIIECKLSASLALLDQAYHWRDQANYISVATPLRCGSVSFRVFCQTFGIGKIVCHVDWEQLECSYDLYPTFRRGKPFGYKWADLLNPRQKTYADAGNADGKFFSPFKNTVEQLEKIAIEKPGIRLSEAIKEIEHHYSADTTARSCIYQWIKNGVIKTVRIENGRLYMSPAR